MPHGVTGRSWTVLASFTGLSCLGASPAPGNVALEYVHPAGCPAESKFREWTADLYDFTEPLVPPGKAAPFVLRVTIEKKESYQAVVLLLNPGGSVHSQIVETGEDCRSVVFASIHRVRRVVPRSPPPEPARDPEAEKKLLRRLDRLEETTEDQNEQIKALDRKIAALNERVARLGRDKMNFTYSLATGALMTLNLTSNVGPGVWVSGGLWSGPLGLGLDLRAVLPSQVDVGPYNFDLSQFVGLLTPCGRYSIFFGCAVAGAGLQIGHDSNFDPRVPPSRYSALVQLGGRVGVEVPLGDSRFAVRGWGEVLYSTPSTSFSYGEGSTVSHSVDRPDVSGFIGLGFVVKFGDEKEGAK